MYKKREMLEHFPQVVHSLYQQTDSLKESGFTIYTTKH